MVTLSTLPKELHIKIAQYLLPPVYALFTSLNRAIRKAINTIPLDYSDLTLSLHDLQKESSRYAQFVGLNLQISMNMLYEYAHTGLSPNLKTLKLHFVLPTSPLEITPADLRSKYLFENFASLQILHLSGCNDTTILSSLYVLNSLIEFKVEKFSKLQKISLVSDCPNIQKVVLHDCPLLAVLGMVTNPLEVVNISDCPMLVHFPFVQINNFYYTGDYFDTSFCHHTNTLNHLYITNALFKMGKILPVESLHLTNCCCSTLPSISTLKNLRIHGCGLNELPFLPSLETIDIGSCSKLTDLTCLNKCAHLRCISTYGVYSTRYPSVSTLTMFSGMNFAHTDLKILQSNSNLTCLELLCNKLTNLDGINHLKQLTTLILCGGNLTSLQGLEHCIYLNKVSLRNMYQLIDIHDLKSCTQIQILDFNCLHVKNVSVLQFLINLQKLRISSCSNVIILPSLVRCTKLEILNLNHSQITQLLALSSSIRRLNLLVSTKLQDIQSVSRCINLVALNLFKCTSLIDTSAIPYSDVLETDLSETGASGLILGFLKSVLL